MLRRAICALAGVAAVAAGCSHVTGGMPVAVETPDEPAVLTIATFGEFGLDELLSEYRSEHPDVTVTVDTRPADGYRDWLATMLAAGTPPDVVLLDQEVHLPALPDETFHDLAEIGPDDVTPEDWLDWAYRPGVAGDGTWFGYCLNSGPMAIAYRTDLLASAGLTDPDELFGSWESYFAAGDRYVAATGKPWFDSTAYLFRAMHSQLATGYFDEDDNLVIESNVDIKANWDLLTAAAGRGQSARLAPFESDWNTGLRGGSFATMLAPYWMLGIMERQGGAENAGKWAIAEVFPGGGGNWGGAYLAVPRGTDHPEAAAELAAWLTAPEQQLAAFRSVHTFPSQVEALESAEVRNSKREYFGDLEIGRLYADLTDEVPTPHHRTRHDEPIHSQAIIPALQSVEDGTPPDQGWRQAVDIAETIAQG